MTQKTIWYFFAKNRKKKLPIFILSKNFFLLFSIVFNTFLAR
nr:MAG TPA: hypothetical protein [Caudoviricetes sp.]